MAKTTFGVVQFACTDSVDQNVATATRLVREAAGAGAQIVLVQELFEDLYFCQEEKAEHFAKARTLDQDHPTLKAMRALAADTLLDVSLNGRDSGMVMMVSREGDHLFVAAALQVHFVRQAAMLDAKSLKEVGDGACPSCGGAPVSSLVVGWAGAHNSRYCICSLCATQWNYVRIKCTLCGSTKGISYQHVEHDKQVRAETCDTCHTYVKVMQQIQNPALDPVADDVASLALDLMVRELGYRRGAVNPFMLGY